MGLGYLSYLSGVWNPTRYGVLAVQRFRQDMDSEMNFLTWGRTYWPVFLIISSAWVTLGFGIPELIALLTGKSSHTDNTLSNYSWAELHVSTMLTAHTLAWYLSFGVWTVFVFVITLHIWFHQFS